MKVCVVTEGHYLIDENKDVYIKSIYGYEFYKRYLQTFEFLIVVGRASYVKKIDKNQYLKVNGAGIFFYPIKSFQGIKGLIKNRKEVKKQIINLVNNVDGAIFRLPSFLSMIVLRIFKKLNKPYILEIVADPDQFFRFRNYKSFFVLIIRILSTYFQKKACKNAAGVSYVTKKFLQNKYPASITAFTSNYSSASIDSIKPKSINNNSIFTISHVANSYTTYGKGHIQLIKAVKILRNRNVQVKVLFIGDGPLREVFERKVKRNSIEESIVFLGKLKSSNEVMEVVKNTNLLVLPTLTEGLPRVLLEAMSIGVPCISSPVSGIPEILNSDQLVDYYDFRELAFRIEKFINDSDLVDKIVKRNYNIVNEYLSSKLNVRRKEFYEELKSLLLEGIS